MKTFILLSLCLFVHFSGTSQSFSSINELINLTKKSPINIEKELESKGFSYNGMKESRHKFSNYSEAISYELNPRVLQYHTTKRTFYLEAYSNLEKSGYLITKSAVTDLDTKSEKEAQLFSKGKTQVFLYQDKDNKDVYSFLIYPDADNKNGNSSKLSISSKGSINFGYGSTGGMFPRGIIQNTHNKTYTVQQAFNGQSGIGSSYGLEMAFGGVIGFDGLNRKLPRFLNFGFTLRAVGGYQPYSFESSGDPFDSYTYSSFNKIGAGGGPAIVLNLSQDEDIKLIGYYDFIPSASFGGKIEYTGTDPDYSQTIERTAATFALIKAFGFGFKYKDFMIGLESSFYYDEAEFENTYGYTGNKTTTTFNSKLPMKQLILKVYFCL